MITFHITKAGKNAIADGVPLKFNRMLLGSGKKPFDADMSQMSNLVEDYPINTVDRNATGRVHLTAIADSDDKEYQINEIGYTLENGILFAYAVQEKPISYKFPAQQILFAFDLDIGDVDIINIKGPGERISLDLAEKMAIMATNMISIQNTQAKLIKRIAELEARL